jgi:DMSO/TMAO reductase YedYZ molybdopterin-dependent catalytic subunit
MPVVTRAVTLECAGNGRALLEPRPASVPWLLEAVGTGTWTGASLSAVLDAVGLGTDAVELVFTGADRGVEAGAEQAYQRSMTIAEATTTEPLLAYELNGMPLPPQHGFPVRLLVPGWYGMASVKWLVSITAVTEPFAGYQNTQAYRLRQQPDEPGDALHRIMVRSLMMPPGLPEFFSRARIVSPGEHTLSGRAWSGHGPIREVEVSIDGGRSWLDAEIDQPTLGPSAWQEWRTRWQAEPGEYELCCRATDTEGNRQPLHAHETWNLGGYANNAVHRIAVRVQ